MTRGCSAQRALLRAALEVLKETAGEKRHLAWHVILHEYVCTAELPQTVEIQDSRSRTIQNRAATSLLRTERLGSLQHGCGNCLQ